MGRICAYRNYAAKIGSAIMQCYASYLEIFSNSNMEEYMLPWKNSTHSNLMHIIQTLVKDLFEESIYLLNGPCNFQFIQAAVDGMLKTEDNVGTKKKKLPVISNLYSKVLENRKASFYCL